MKPDAIAALLRPYIDLEAPLPNGADGRQICQQLSLYLTLILRWNARTNLTAIRDPEEIVRRHFGESLFAASHLSDCKTLLDYGSGAGFPGIPIQLLRPDLRITLSESQGKKAAFLREAVRELHVETEIWAARVADMPPDRMFDVIALRAVDKMEKAIRDAALRSSDRIMILSTQDALDGSCNADGFERTSRIALPESANGILELLSRA